MGKPISAIASTSAPIQSTTTQSARQGSVEQSPIQSTPTQSSPVQSAPVKFWPPAYGWRLSALEGQRSAHNGWQSKWLEHGSAIAGGGPVDSVAELKVKLRGHLSHGAR